MAVCRVCGCQAVEDRLGSSSREGRGELYPGEAMSCICYLFDLLLDELTTHCSTWTSVFGQGLVAPNGGVGLEWKRLDLGTMPPLLFPRASPNLGLVVSPGGKGTEKTACLERLFIFAHPVDHHLSTHLVKTLQARLCTQGAQGLGVEERLSQVRRMTDDGGGCRAMRMDSGPLTCTVKHG